MRCNGLLSGRSILGIAAACGVVGGIAGSSNADFNYTDFSSTSGLTLLGNATRAGNVLRLTPASSFQVGAAWHQVKQGVGDGFSTAFAFRVHGLAGGGADGFALVIQNTGLNAIGGNGCRNGFDGIPNSLAIEFDTWDSTSCEAGEVNDPNDNHVSVLTRGTLPNSAAEVYSLGSATGIPNISDGQTHQGMVTYQGGVLSVFIDNLVNPVLSESVDLGAILSLDGVGAWVGFTGATGGSSENHDLLSWSFTDNFGGGGPPFRPNPPVITEPVVDGKIVNAADVHMETGPFADADQDLHRCTDWEIWTVNPSERVWEATCVTDEALKMHIHLADGNLIGSHSGLGGLKQSTDYRLRVRFRDDSQDPGTEYSLWSQRLFRTGDPAQIFPLQMRDIEIPPQIRWVNGSGAPIVLPAATTPPSLTVGGADGSTLVVVRGFDGVTNTVIDAAPLGAHIYVRLHLAGGSAGVSLAASALTVLGDDCSLVTMYLPAITCPVNQSRYYWVSITGSTYSGSASQTTPVFTQLARGTLQPWSSFDSDLEVERFATGFQLPVSIAMTGLSGPGQPVMYVAELYGQIRTVFADGTKAMYASGLLNFNPSGAFPGSGEMGLASICREPVSGDLFATLLYANNGNTSQLYPRVIRLHSDDGITMTSNTTVLSMPGELMSASHQISNISIGPDGKLYVHVGDGFNAGTAQNTSSFRGKILRMELNGAACMDNPLYNAGNGITATDYIYSYGHRNPFGGGWRASDGRHFVVENGPGIDRFLFAARGVNYGWDGSDGSMGIGAQYVWNPAHAPVTIAIIEPQTFGGSGFASDWYGSVIVTESGPTWAQGPQGQGKRLVRFRVNAAGTVTEGPTTLVEYAGAGRGTAVAIAAGPDGLYFSDLYKDLDYVTPIDAGGSIFRVRYRAPADCNQNGVDDRCDINRGVLLDTDNNGVPDECECVSDFDGSGFVDTDDFDAYVMAFIAGDESADVDGSGFVDTDDFDAFVHAFEAGC